MNRVAAVLTAFPLLLLASRAPAVAGDVNLKIDHGTLRVRGSDGPDGLYIFIGPDGTAFVTPIATTTVNGVAGMQQFQYVTKDAFLDLGDGNDALTLGGTFPRDVRASLGDGDDQFAAQCTIDRSLDARLGDGRDRIDVHDTDVIGNARLDAGDAWQAIGLTSDQIGGSLVVKLGNQPIANDGCTIKDVEVGSRVLIRTVGDQPPIALVDSRLHGKTRIVQRGGTAAWELIGCAFDDDLAIRASGNVDVETTVATLHGGYSFVGSGKHTASWLSVAGVSGAVTMRSSADLAEWNLHQCSITGRTRIDLHRAAESHGWSGYPSFAGAARIELSRGYDVLDMHHATAAERVVLAAGAGNDELTIGECDWHGDLRVSLGAGNDVLELGGAVDGDLFAELGAGNDAATLSTVTVAGKKTVKEGGGADVVN